MHQTVLARGCRGCAVGSFKTACRMWTGRASSCAFSASATGPAASRTRERLRTIETLNLEHTFVKELPGDPNRTNKVRQVEGALFSYVDPTPTGTEPYLVAFSPDVCELLDLDPRECERPEFARVMSGNAALPGSHCYSQCYGGHQFGSWAGQLGDGRAITMGEVVNHAGGRWELQLKGAGLTPYSRFADGRAVMRSSVREFVASEALHYLGIPTTRALCLVGTGAEVMRDMFYDGRAQYEPGAVVCRVAPSFVRFGSFQLPASRGAGQAALVGQLADYVLQHHYPDLADSPNPYLALLQEVTQRTARLVAQWQGVGFVHGVLNTDNMSILGLTIDYGPYGFMDTFDPKWTPNSTDVANGRRYCYGNQLGIGQWNLVRLAEALLEGGLMTEEEATEVLEGYQEAVISAYKATFARKLGLREYDQEIAGRLNDAMFTDGADFTNTWRALADVSAEEPAAGSPQLPPSLRAAIGPKLELPGREEVWGEWLKIYRARLRAEAMAPAERVALQKAASPKFVPRQHLLHYAIQGVERGEYGELQQLMAVLRRPYDDQPEADPKYSSPPPQEMIRPGVCVLSCSS